MRVLLLAIYEMGRQPFGLASPAAWLREAGCDVRALDLSRQRLDADAVRDADLIACHLPMHTATRLLPPVLAQIRTLNPAAHRCAYGLYAPLNAAWLRDSGVQTILGPECEADLVALTRRLATRATDVRDPAASETEPMTSPHDATAASGPLPALVPAPLPRLAFRVPDRRDLPSLDRYARLRIDGETRSVGYTEATRGCKHLCRHCPIVPVYNGRFRAVPADVVLADVRQQIAQGARHITFGDPDFFNGPTHARTIVTALAGEWPGVTYDVTIKVEHLLAHRDLLPLLRDTGCLFVTSAVEAVDDAVLERLAKGHTRADFVDAAAICREHGLTLVPTFVSFTPWTTIDGYRDLLRTIRELDLVHHVPSVQLTIRLLIPQGSRLMELADVRALIGPFDRTRLVYPWTHADPAVDALQEHVSALVGRSPGAGRDEVFARIEALAGLLPPDPPPRLHAAVPSLDEPWYCCAEPTGEQVALL